MDISPHVRLIEGRHSGNRRKPPGADTGHLKGNQADPGVAVVRVDLKTGRQQRFDFSDRDFPMDEQQIGPALVAGRSSLGLGRR